LQVILIVRPLIAAKTCRIIRLVVSVLATCDQEERTMTHKRLWGGLGGFLAGLSHTTNLLIVGLGISLVGMITLLTLIVLIRRAA
jgi:hypothetical protein